MGFLLRVLANALAILLAAAIVPGIEIRGALAALGAGLVLGLVNAVVRPILVILTLPLTLVTLGLFLLVINGLLFYFVGSVVKEFHVDSFGWAMAGSVEVSIVNALLTRLIDRR